MDPFVLTSKLILVNLIQGTYSVSFFQAVPVMLVMGQDDLPPQSNKDDLPPHSNKDDLPPQSQILSRTRECGAGLTRLRDEHEHILDSIRSLDTQSF